MAAMDTSGGRNRHSETLPPIGRLDFDKMKVDSIESHQAPSSGSYGISTSTMVSPTYVYSGPPPPYTYPAPTTAPTIAHNTVTSSAESQRLPPEKDDPSFNPNRQALPSIQEALADQKYPLSPATTHHAPPPPPPPSASLSQGTTVPPPQILNPHPHPLAPSFSTAPVDPLRSTVGGYAEHRQSALQPHAIQTQQSHPPPPPPPPPLSAPPHSSSQPSHHSDPFQRSQPPPLTPSSARSMEGIQQNARSADEHVRYSPRHESEPSSAGSMHPPFSSYPSYMPHYPFQSQPSHISNQPPPSPYRTPGMETSQLSYPQSRFDGPEVARIDETRKHGVKGSHGEIYGYSVRRHLEYFDLEASLNGIMEGSGRLFDIARYHQTRAKESRAENHSPTPMPTIDECDRMLQHNSSVQQNITNMRDMLLTQQQSVANQHSQSQRFKGPVDYEADDGSMYEEPKSGGLLGSDSKKRRARAAPPGRCHSCNRAETPEWRRGPDGARTLCNACGLHYAKLTRKTKAAMHTSSMRSKMVESPPPP